VLGAIGRTRRGSVRGSVPVLRAVASTVLNRRTRVGLAAVVLLAACGTARPKPDTPAPTPVRAPAASGTPAAGPGSADGSESAAPAAVAGPIAAVRVASNRFVDDRGATVRLLGFNHAGAEYSCIEGTGIFDTPGGAPPSTAVVQAMRAWRGTTAVRVPLNEQCWLGLPSAPARFAGAAYRSAVTTFVTRLNDAGLVAVLDLHRSAPARAASKEQEPMPDRDHSPAFWRSVAATFAHRPAVVFDLFNEPFPYGETDSARAWRCWRDGGCRLTSVNSRKTYVAAGMAELIAAVRSTGARNVVLAGGLHWAEGMTHWLAYRPADPAAQLAASFHAYSFNEYCATPACYERDLVPLLRAVPLFVGEIGPTLRPGITGADPNCPRSAVVGGGFAAATLDWLNGHGASWTAWTWNTWTDCWALVRSLDGTPTPGWGAEIRRRLAVYG
jgi:endoglucanase